jgi:hypothetical protein
MGPQGGARRTPLAGDYRDASAVGEIVNAVGEAQVLCALGHTGDSHGRQGDPHEGCTGLARDQASRTALAISLGTAWGLSHHYGVAMSLALTVVATDVACTTAR